MNVFHKLYLALIYCHNKIAQYNSANVKLSNPLLNKLKLATKIETGITLKLSQICLEIVMMRLIFHISY